MSITVNQVITIDNEGAEIILTRDEAIELRDALLEAFPVEKKEPYTGIRDLFPHIDPLTPIQPYEPTPRWPSTRDVLYKYPGTVCRFDEPYPDQFGDTEADIKSDDGPGIETITRDFTGSFSTGD